MKCFLTLITVTLGLLVCTGQIFSAEYLREIEVVGVRRDTLIANRGADHGVVENSVYAIHRIRESGIIHLGIAVVSHVAEDSCYFKAYRVSRSKIKPGDHLVLEESATESLMDMQNDGYWINLQSEKRARNSAFSDGKILKRARVKLKSGETLDLKKITVRRNEDIMLPSKTGFPECIKLNDIEAVSVPTKSYSLYGAVIGAVLGSAMVLIMDTGHTVERKDRVLEKYKYGIIAGGFFLGTILGQRFKGGWKKLYPDEERISFDISPCNGPDETLRISMQFRF
jgi:hypothetical protein